MQECCEWFHNSKFDIMMARMTPVSLHFSDVPTGWKKNLYRQTTVGYWFCMFVTNSLSRRTLLQINLRQLHSVPFEWKQHIYVFRAIHHIDPLHRKQALQFSRSHGQTLQKPREVQEMLQIPVCQSSLVSRTFSVHIRIWMFTLCTMHLVSTSTSEPRKEVLGNLYNFMH